MPLHYSDALTSWYRVHHRDLPWRRTSDPYAIWISEIMLQQTRVATVIPYYERFLARFPTIRALAEAEESDLLSHWAGLGYYYRARNMQKAARQMGPSYQFPKDYEQIRALPGIGDYTSAAIASIAFGLPYAVVDGNVLRVISRLKNDPSDIASQSTRRRFQTEADSLLDRAEPGLYNQAIMELGATICLPRNPQCLVCPVASFCEARRHGTQDCLPVKTKNTKSVDIERTLLLIQQDGKLLFHQRPPDSSLMPGFYELPEPEHLPGAEIRATHGSFRHGITFHNYTFHVVQASLKTVPDGYFWLSQTEWTTLPLSTIARKAIARFLSTIQDSRV